MNADLIFNELKEKILSKLNFTSDMENEQLSNLIDCEITEVSKKIFISVDKRIELKKSLLNSIRGFDILEEFLSDESVTEIMVNSYNKIFVEKNGKISLTDKAFSSEKKLSDVIQQIVAAANKRVNQSSPIVDTRLNDGSRVNIVLKPISIDDSALTIRRFPKRPLTIDNLIASGSITLSASHMLKLLVESRYNIFISGGTGSGKTTFLNILSNYIPCDQRVITIEDSAELQLMNLNNLIRLETRDANTEGENAVTIRDLIKTSLRMRPDRIIVGEVRGFEALDMLQAMSTGHDGSLSTGHGNNEKDMLMRLETMVLMGINMPVIAIRNQIASAIDIMVHLGRLRDGSRKILSISEVIGVENDVIKLSPLYVFEENPQLSTNTYVAGTLKRQALSLYNTSKLSAAGFKEEDLWI